MFMSRDSDLGHSTESDSLLRSRLRLFLEVTEISQREFAARSLVPQAAVSRFLAGASLGEANAARVLTSMSTLSAPTVEGGSSFADQVAWACRNVEVMRDTDVLPCPREFALLSRTSVPILAALGAVDLASHAPRTPRTFVAPKMTGGFRTVTQLDPTDTLLYSAAVHAIAPAIEASRAPTDQVFSFRLAAREDGYLWRTELGWVDFVARAKVLSEEETCSYVLVADISDFYGQIGISTVGEALEDAGVSTTWAKNIGNMLVSYAGRRGRGLPIGPHPSALLAEAVLGRVDRHLLRNGRPFVRYVDDIRIFCGSLRDARAAWHDLASFLAERLGLGLNDAKTRIDTAQDFAANEDTAVYADPEEFPLPEAAEDASAPPASNFWARALHEIHRREFAQALDPGEGSLRRVRRILRRAPATSLDDMLLDQAVLVRLVPVMRELSLYLLKPRGATSGEQLAPCLIWLAEESEWADIPFVRLWVAEVLSARFAGVAVGRLEAFLRRARPDIGLSAAAVLAVSRGDREWVRSHEKDWENLSPWDRRAVCSAVGVLTDIERERWAHRAEENPARDPLLIALAHEIRAGSRGTP